MRWLPNVMLAVVTVIPVGVIAAEDLVAPRLGLDLSFSGLLANERALSGSLVGYGLTLLRVGVRGEVGILYEHGDLSGESGGDRIGIDTRLVAGRVVWPVIDAGGQRVSVLAHAGHVAYSSSENDGGAFVADLGVTYDPWHASARGITTAFGIQARYRWCHVSPIEVGGTTVDDAGGFLIGVHGVTF
jgi:hypothetical protein